MRKDDYKRKALNLIDEMIYITDRYVAEIQDLEDLLKRLTEDVYDQNQITHTQYRDIEGFLDKKDEILKGVGRSLMGILERLAGYIGKL